MNTKNIADFASWFATIAGFVFACIGIFSQPPTLQTSRPQIPNPAEAKKSEQNQVSRSQTAELWDDPFAVFGSPKEIPEVDKAKTYKSPALLLVVLSDIGKYESDSEARLRDRYAIETALLNSDYISESPGELKSVTVCMRGTEILVPVENFRRRVVQNAKIMQGSDNSFCFVEVAWLPEHYLPSDSWENICAFLQGKQSDLAPQYSNCELCILGPTGSNLLAQMCPVVQPAAPKNNGAVTYPRILNFEATAPSPLTRIFALEDKETDKFFRTPKVKIISALNNSEQWQGKQSILVTTGPQIIERLGADEFDLCRKLVSEIDRRTKTTGWGRKHVLLIAEWDTLYGRAAALAFELAAAGCKSYNLVRDAIDGTKDETKPPHFDIDRFSYMRGLDGTATLYREKYPAEPVSPTQQSGKVEPPEGVSQFDYIRRLSDSIGTVPFFLSPTVQEPDAIVILGSDAYDKLTLLKLLRTRFSRSLYGTTGLDALYWSPEYVRYTRNMIVAASLPMEVWNVEPGENGSKSGDSQGAQTPGTNEEGLPIITHLRKVVFRDSYQSALYQAVVCAIERKPVPGWTTTAKLFEVGNTQPVSIDASEWNRRATPMAWQGYFEGVNAAASLLLQAVLVIVGAIYLSRLRVLKYEQRQFPPEFYSNIESQLPIEFHGIIGEFQKLVNDLMEWSSRQLPGKNEIIDIDTRARALRDKVNAIREVTESVAKEKKEDLLAALNRVLERLHPGGTPGEHGSNPNNPEFDRILGRRKLRVSPSWIAKIVVPVIRSAAASEKGFATEISEFEKYTDLKPFRQDPVYKALGLVAIILFVVYFCFNPNFEGIVGTELRQIFGAGFE